MVRLEVCVESVRGARTAAAAGAARVELCSALDAGGLTPSEGALTGALAVRGLEVCALVRPRAGDFLYDAEELACMERDVARARDLRCHAVAVGCLTEEGDVDEDALARLVEQAGGMEVTFHRALDHVRDPERALGVLARLGVKRVLTSGQAASALEGAARIAGLVRAAGGALRVVAAGGVRPENVERIVRASGVEEVHCALRGRRESRMRFRNEAARLAGGDAGAAYGHGETDGELVGAMVRAVGGL